MNKMLLRNDNITNNNNNTTQFLCVHFASFSRGMLQIKRKKQCLMGVGDKSTERNLSNLCLMPLNPMPITV